MNYSDSSSPLSSPPPSPSMDGLRGTEATRATLPTSQPAERDGVAQPAPVPEEGPANGTTKDALQEPSGNILHEPVEDVLQEPAEDVFQEPTREPSAACAKAVEPAEVASSECINNIPSDSAPMPPPVSPIGGMATPGPTKKRRIKPQLISQPQLGSQPQRDLPEPETDKKREPEPEAGMDGGPAKKRKVQAAKKTRKQTSKGAGKKATKLATVTPKLLKKWQPGFVTQDSKSPLANADIRSILFHPLAWASLTPEDKAEIINVFPDNGHILKAGTPDAIPNVASLRSDDNFRYDTARFSEHIADGRHDPQWLHGAWMAHERNHAGEFDEFEARTFEEDWSLSLPENMKGPALRGNMEINAERESESGSSTATMAREDGGDKDDKLAGPPEVLGGCLEMSDVEKTKESVPEAKPDAATEGTSIGENGSERLPMPATTNGPGSQAPTSST